MIASVVVGDAAVRSSFADMLSFTHQGPMSRVVSLWMMIGIIFWILDFELVVFETRAGKLTRREWVRDVRLTTFVPVFLSFHKKILSQS
jgi:hypothetical protein